MHSSVRLLNIPALAVALAVVAAATGCGSSPAGPAAPAAASHIYTMQQSGSDATEADTVVAFSTSATGSAIPASTLALPTGFAAYSLAAGPNGELYIGGGLYVSSILTTPEILEFAPAAHGAATPALTLTGGTEGTFANPSLLAVSPQGQLSVADNLGYIYTFPTTLTASSAPASQIATVVQNQGEVLGLAVDGSGSIYVADGQNGVIDVFASGASGDAAPTRTITGSSTGAFSFLLALSVDKAGNLAVDNYNQADDIYEAVSGTPVRRFHAPKLYSHMRKNLSGRPHDDPSAASTAIFIFAPGASGNATPIRTLSGASTNIYEPAGIALDQLDNVYYLDFAGGTPMFMTFPSTATGNVAPATTFADTGASLFSYQNLAIF